MEERGQTAEEEQEREEEEEQEDRSVLARSSELVMSNSQPTGPLRCA